MNHKRARSERLPPKYVTAKPGCDQTQKTDRTRTEGGYYLRTKRVRQYPFVRYSIHTKTNSFGSQCYTKKEGDEKEVATTISDHRIAGNDQVSAILRTDIAPMHIVLYLVPLSPSRFLQSEAA